jgi:hypothetical protein
MFAGNKMSLVNKNIKARDARVYQYEWILCPLCGNKTRVKIRDDTVLENFPLFCPKCKQETIINVKHLNVSVIKEPDA